MSLGVVAHQAPLSKAFSRQEYWSGLPCPPPGNLLDPGIKPVSHTSPALAGKFFTTDTTWEAQGKWKLMMLNTVFIYLSAIWVSGYLSGKTPAKVCVCFLKCFIGVSFSRYTDFLGYILFQILFPLCSLPLKLSWWSFLMNTSSELIKSCLSVFFFVVSTLFFFFFPC